jgi:RimJ/RimL family protein N-acetyltransferase
MPFDLETARLQLCPLTLAEVDEFHRLCTGENFRKYLFDNEVIPLELAASFIATSNSYFEESGYGLWAVRQRGQTPLIGFCGFWYFHEPPELELLYGIAEPCWEWDLPLKQRKP